MSVTLDQFINAWTNKKVPSRGGITGQCVSLVQHWAEDQGVTGTPVFPVGNAYQMAGLRPDYFTWVANSATNYPSPGDIIVWNKTWGGGAGHTGIVTSANVNSFQAFEQNNPTGSGAHLVNHPNYSGVLGWLKFKSKPQEDNVNIIVKNKQGYEGDAAFWVKAYDERNDQWTQVQTVTLPALQKQIADLQAQAKSQQDQIATLNTQLKTSADKVAELEKQVKDNPDTVLLDQSGGWLKQLWARLFGGK